MILTKLKMAVLAGLVAITLSTSYLSYTFYGKMQVLELRHDDMMLELREKDRQLTNMEASCKIDQEVMTKVASESESLGEDLNTILESLNDLTTKENGRENVQPVKHVPTLGIPAAVAPRDNTIQRVLDDAFCAADPDDSYCTARVATETTPNKKS